VRREDIRAFERIHAEFSEMPGMRLTPEQVERLSGVDRAVCQGVLDDLVRAKFLNCVNGSYGRRSDTSTSESRGFRGDGQLAAVAQLVGRVDHLALAWQPA
jgi:hypothetical protein